MRRGAAILVIVTALAPCHLLQADTAAWLRAADTLYRGGEMLDAALYMEVAVKEDPYCGDCWRLLARSRYALGSKREALWAYRMLLGVSPGEKGIASLVEELEQEVEAEKKETPPAEQAMRRRRSGWGVMIGVPGGISFARRLQDIYSISFLLGSRFDDQVLFNVDVFARFPLDLEGKTFLGLGLGWTTIAGGNETAGRTLSGDILKVARETHAGPNLPCTVSYFFGRTELFLQANLLMEVTPENKFVGGGGLGVRWYIEAD